MLNIIYNAAQALIAKSPEILTTSQVIIDVQHDALIRLFYRYGAEFLKARNLKDSTLQKQSRMLRAACSHFEGTAIDFIDTKTILMDQQGHSPLNSRSLQLLNRFWEFCASKLAMPPNPISDYKQNYKTKPARDGEKIALSRGTETCMDYEKERKLKQLILASDLRDPGIRCTALMVDANMTAALIANLIWRNVVFDPNDPYYVRLKLPQKDGGPVQNYDHPVFPFLAKLLHLAFELDSSRFSGSNILDRHVITSKKGNHSLRLKSPKWSDRR